MKQKKFLCAALLLTTVSLLVAQEITVDYIDGYLDIQKGGDWVEVYTGDSLSKNAVLRLDEDSLAELSGMNMSFVLTRPGIYNLTDMLASRQTMNTSGIGNIVTNKVSSLFTEKTSSPDTVGGVRAAEVETEPTIDWMTSEAADMISQAKDLITEGNYMEAMDLLDEAYDYAADDYEEYEIFFYKGYINTVSGKVGKALAEFNRITPDPDQPFYDDLFFLKGSILVDSFAFDDAMDWFAAYQPAYKTGKDVSTPQSVYLLYGMAARQAGFEPKAKTLFKKVVELNPNSEAGSIATTLLQK